MRGLVYKENMIFIKSIDKKMILLVIAAIILLLYNSGDYAGLFATVMLAMTVGMQNILCFASDEKVDWKKYQMAMPVSSFTAVRAKYSSVVCTTAACIAGGIVFNLLSSIVFRRFDGIVWGASMAVAFAVPLLWTGIGLPLAYWFGFRSAQTIGLVAVAPMFCFVKYFEDGAGFAVMGDSILSYGIALGVGTVVIFLGSMIISVAGYSRRK